MSGEAKGAQSGESGAAQSGESGAAQSGESGQPGQPETAEPGEPGQPGQPGQPGEPETGRHASWLELFFDLVVVVAVAQLAHRLHGHEGNPAWPDVLVFAVLYLAVWLVWSSFTLYANVAAEKTRLRLMLIGMAAIAVMATAIPEATGERGWLFAAAYIAARVIGMRTWGSARQILTSWPVAQHSVGLAPWVISIWVEQPAQLYLWIVGLAADLWFSFGGGRDPGQLVQRQRKRRDETSRRSRDRSGRRPPPIPVVSARLDTAHLGERLGLFVIIVLGEAVLQVVTAASEGEWDRRLVAVGAASFVLLIGLWWLAFRYGFGEWSNLTVRLLMPAHFLMVASITVVAAGLGVLTQHAHGHLEAGGRWLLCAGLAIYLAISALLAVRVEGAAAGRAHRGGPARTGTRRRMVAAVAVRLGTRRLCRRGGALLQAVRPARLSLSGNLLPCHSLARKVLTGAPAGRRLSSRHQFARHAVVLGGR